MTLGIIGTPQFLNIFLGVPSKILEKIGFFHSAGPECLRSGTRGQPNEKNNNFFQNFRRNPKENVKNLEGTPCRQEVAPSVRKLYELCHFF